MGSNAPVLLVIEDTLDDLHLVGEALERRFGSDFGVITSATAAEGMEMLERLAQDGAPVALVAAGLRAITEAVDVLRRARALHPGARRALFLPMSAAAAHGPGMDAILRAMALGELDFSILKGWVSPEEWLYPQVQEALSEWVNAHRPRHEHFQIVGEQWSPRSHDLRDILTRNRVPFGFYPADSDAGRRLLADHGLNGAQLPVLIAFDGRVLVAPDNQSLAEALGVRTRPGPDRYDVAIVGAGPAGLAAAVYGASEGLRTLVIEPEALGGQAGTSSRIRNYLGFPRGVSGNELMARAYEQARVFGAEFTFTRRASALLVRGENRVVGLSGGVEALARSVVIATGASYRRLGVATLDRLVGTGVFYGAVAAEARAMSGQDVLVVGAGNSAGQAALHLARFAARVTMLVRGESLAASMSDYLVQELATSSNVEIRAHTRVVDGRGEYRLESATVEDTKTGHREDLPAMGMFVLIGAQPRTEWLADVLARDAAGYIQTGRDVPRERWPLDRAPMLLETSLPGVFAVGDVRRGSVKRVAAAVGEGSVVIGSVHQYLTEVAGHGTGSA
ncbi:MAG TPA: FAD-dependent oxidoreductase [Myxococcaceae bacterium]|nr:FAD-dependent oxidoreductase [Myxococcaceae bacterium]